MPSNPPSIDIRDVPGLADVVDRAARTGEVLLTRNGEPVPRIVPVREPAARGRRPGSARGMVHMADDFDAMPKELEPYF